MLSSRFVLPVPFGPVNHDLLAGKVKLAAFAVPKVGEIQLFQQNTAAPHLFFANRHDDVEEPFVGLDRHRIQRIVQLHADTLRIAVAKRVRPGTAD